MYVGNKQLDISDPTKFSTVWLLRFMKYNLVTDGQADGRILVSEH